MSSMYRVPGAVLTEREHTVPLDHARPGRAARSRCSPARSPIPTAGRTSRTSCSSRVAPASRRRGRRARPSGWMARALKDYRVLLLDQRGTGRSTPVGEIPGDTPAAQAAYLTHFRADAIVRDAELIRPELGVERWSVLGQSFGGFTSMTYLSIAPRGAARGAHHRRPGADRAPGRRRLRRDLRPADRARTSATSSATRTTAPGSSEIHRRLEAEDVRLPVRRPARRAGGSASWGCGWATAPASSCSTTCWSCRSARGRSCPTSRTRSASRATRSTRRSTSRRTRTAARRAGRPTGCCPTRSGTRRLFTAEHVFPWMFEDYGALRSHREAAKLLAEHDWPRLYDAGPAARTTRCRSRRRSTSTTCTWSAIFAEETAAAIRGLRPWITNEYEHNGLRADGERVLGRLIDLVRGRA